MHVTSISTLSLKINKEVCNTIELNMNILLFKYRNDDYVIE